MNRILITSLFLTLSLLSFAQAPRTCSQVWAGMDYYHATASGKSEDEARANAAKALAQSFSALISGKTTVHTTAANKKAELRYISEGKVNASILLKGLK